MKRQKAEALADAVIAALVLRDNDQEDLGHESGEASR
jgi:hypothetical protein